MAHPSAAIIIIGNEVLSGRTQDKHVSFFASELEKLGIPVVEVRIIRDQVDLIAKHVNELRFQATYVFTTGGIGPTHDDVTAEGIACAFSVEVEENPEALNILLEYYGDQINEGRRRMARMPKGARLISNPLSSAPGFFVENVYTFAGIPSVAQAMFFSIAAQLQKGEEIFSSSHVFEIPESLVAMKLAHIQSQYDDVEIGSYPYFKQGKVGTTIIGRSKNSGSLNRAMEDIRGITF